MIAEFFLRNHHFSYFLPLFRFYLSFFSNNERGTTKVRLLIYVNNLQLYVQQEQTTRWTDNIAEIIFKEKGGKKTLCMHALKSSRQMTALPYP